MKLLKLATVVALVLGSLSCASLAKLVPVLTDVIAAVQDGEQILSSIEAFEKAYFAAHPNAELQGKVDSKVAFARRTLNFALRSSRAVKELDQQHVDASFADFKAAYTELLALVSSIGIHSGEGLRAAPGELQVPTPIALDLKVRS